MQKKLPTNMKRMRRNSLAGEGHKETWKNKASVHKTKWMS